MEKVKKLHSWMEYFYHLQVCLCLNNHNLTILLSMNPTRKQEQKHWLLRSHLFWKLPQPAFVFVFSTANKVTLSMDNLTHLSRINFHPATASVHSGAALEVELILQCLMPMPVRIQQLAASIHFALEQVGTNGRSKASQRQTSGGSVEFHQRSSSAAPPSSAPYVSLELEEIHDRSPTDNSLNSTGVVCKNTHLVIRRHDSSSPADTPSNLSPAAVTMKEGAQMLKVHDVTLQPGTNSIMFTAPVSVYSEGHLK